MGIDEAHCVSYWGSSFRKHYGTLGSVRTFLPKGAAVVAVSATMTKKVRRSVAQTLHYKKDFLHIDIGNTRRDISLVASPIYNPLNTFEDLNFTIPANYNDQKDIPKQVIYSDDIEEGGRMIDYLTSRLRPEHQDLGLIRPFHSTHTHKYRETVLQKFREGSIRILVCTDLFGMVILYSPRTADQGS